MAYTDYSFYQNTYKGNKIPSESYDYFAERASELITSLTFFEIDGTNDKVKKCECAIAEMLVAEEKVQGIKSQSVGKVSVSYDTDKTVQDKAYLIAHRYLFGLGYLYRGVTNV